MRNVKTVYTTWNKFYTSVIFFHYYQNYLWHTGSLKYLLGMTFLPDLVIYLSESSLEGGFISREVINCAGSVISLCAWLFGIPDNSQLFSWDFRSGMRSLSSRVWTSRQMLVIISKSRGVYLFYDRFFTYSVFHFFKLCINFKSMYLNFTFERKKK